MLGRWRNGARVGAWPWAGSPNAMAAIQSLPALTLNAPNPQLHQGLWGQARLLG